MKNLLYFLTLFTLVSNCKNTTTAEELICDGIRAPEPEPQATKAYEVFPNIEDVIPTGYQLVQTRVGEELIYEDLNGDNKTDAVALIELRGDTTYDYAEEVLLVVYTADQHGQFQIAAASKNLGGESVSYDDSKKLSLKKNVIQYNHQSMRHQIDVKYRYEPKYGDFMLIGKEYHDYGSASDGPRQVSINYLTGVKHIDESYWSEESEALEALPRKKEKVSKTLQALSSLNWDTLYNDL
jgi:hypothetical protein